MAHGWGEDVHRDFGVKYSDCNLSSKLQGHLENGRGTMVIAQGCRRKPRLQPARTPGRPESTEVWAEGHWKERQVPRMEGGLGVAAFRKCQV